MIEISTCKILKGELPPRQIRLVSAWVELHRDDLMANWNLLANGEQAFKIPPL